MDCLEEEYCCTLNIKKISFFSVISLSRNYQEDPHWFIMGFKSGMGLIRMGGVGVGHGVL